MSFLRLDGFVIPIEDGSAKVVPQDIGQSRRAFSGSMLSDRRAIKRRWTVKTNPVSELVALAIEGAAKGLGDSWSFDFDDAARLTGNLFGSKGTGPGSTVGSVRFGTAKDGSNVVDEVAPAVLESKFGSGSGTVERATTNILTVDQRDVEGVVAGNFTAVAGGVLALEVNTVLQGNQSLKITTAAANDGAETDTVPAAASTAYVGSVYVKVGGGIRSVNVILIDDVGTIATKLVPIFGPNWTRIQVTGSTAVGATAIKIRVTDAAAGGTVLFADAFQIELGSVATTWADPTRAAGNLAYPPSLVTGATDLTFNAWARAPSVAAGARTLFNSAGLSDSFVLKRAATDTIDFFTNPGGDTINASIFTGVFRMVTAVLRSNPESGENVKTLYVDGVLAGTSNPTAPDLSTFTKVEVGHQDDGSNTWGAEGLFDDMRILPFAATTAQILAWFNMGKSASNLRRVFIDGDIMPDNQLVRLVEGTSESEFLVGKKDNASGSKGNLRQVSLVLEEV